MHNLERAEQVAHPAKRQSNHHFVIQMYVLHRYRLVIENTFRSTVHIDASSRLIAVALLTFTAVVAIYFSRDAQARTLRVPDTVEKIGAFELVTRGNALARTDYALRYRGAPFEFAGKSGMFGDKAARYKTFNAMFTFATETRAILVNVGDPNNGSFFYLLRDDALSLDVVFLETTS